MGRLRVGQAEAVDILIGKVQNVLTGFGDNLAGHRLRQAVGHARTRHRQVHTRDNRGFYHGLITGYAVAMKVLQGTVSGSRSAPVPPDRRIGYPPDTLQRGPEAFLKRRKGGS